MSVEKTDEGFLRISFWRVSGEYTFKTGTSGESLFLALGRIRLWEMDRYRKYFFINKICRSLCLVIGNWCACLLFAPDSQLAEEMREAWLCLLKERREGMPFRCLSFAAPPYREKHSSGRRFYEVFCCNKATIWPGIRTVNTHFRSHPFCILTTETEITRFVRAITVYRLLPVCRQA
ncbi:hypothetical protein OFAG_02135 [Oxalobacter formigenes HOxBLS]|uniref:Uncharacterized protein n=1 Tax=Oxalobacter paraformigenes TaxID=556268 RepID=T5LTC9_9BURK|nr:hypothetical protein OFAG_02135 [Oxalobacter paraformigenes]